MSASLPVRPTQERLDLQTPSSLLMWAMNCLTWARQNCTNHGTWQHYYDNGIMSVRGEPNQLDREGGAICTDAAENALWIAFASPAFGSLVEHLLLTEVTRRAAETTWSDPIDPWRMTALVIINRYYDLVGAI